MAYTTTDELKKIRSDVGDLAISDFSDFIASADAIINREIDTRWYRDQADERGVDFRDTAFDSSLLLSASTQLTRAGSYLVLALVYEYASRGDEDDSAWKLAKWYRNVFREEMDAVLREGLDYDWDSDGSLADTETKQYPFARVLKRM